MTVGLRLFLSSMTFGIVIAIAYWIVAREPAGTLLLGCMAFALSVIAGYMVFAERKAKVWGDRGDASHHDADGEIVGTYSAHSPLPFFAALATAVVLVGIVTSPALAVIGMLGMFGFGALFILQSR